MISIQTIIPGFVLLLLFSCILTRSDSNASELPERKRADEIGVHVGMLPSGPLNMITDVSGVKVGHTTRIEGDHVRTGVTAILPHDGNIFREKVPAAIYNFNSFGKMAGSLQVDELGNIETPIILTNTLSVGTAVESLVAYVMARDGNEQVRSVNALVGETNDGYLNDIRGQHITKQDVFKAIENAESGVVQEGNVGAGTGTRSFGYKSGIGTSSRIAGTIGDKQYTVGVLVQSNFGRDLYLNGVPFTRELQKNNAEDEGSAMIIIATDAPLSDRNLKRMARRSFMGMGRTTGYMSNFSGDFAIAFSTAYTIPPGGMRKVEHMPALIGNNEMNPLFQAVEEATQKAIYNALFMSEGMTGRNGNRMDAIPLDTVIDIMQQYNMLHLNDRL